MKMGEWRGVIEEAVSRQVSDIHMTAGQHVFFRKDGRLLKQDFLCEESWLKECLDVMLVEEQRERLAERKELDFSWEYGGARFRGNAYQQRGHIAVALRWLPDRIPTLDEIGAPKALRDLLQQEQGLCLVTGRTGSGKTTTLAAFLAEMDRQRAAHIVTLEDPIEFLHEPQHCFFSQRELGRDFLSFPLALRSALREMPEVILVGEIRDAETMETALMAAETGILVLGTLHTRSAAETAMRVEGMFPAGQRDSVRDRLAAVFTGFFSQRLVPAITGGRVSVTEVLLSTAASRNIIRQGKYQQLNSVMMSGTALGMQTDSMALQKLMESGKIARSGGDSLERGGRQAV